MRSLNLVASPAEVARGKAFARFLRIERAKRDLSKVELSKLSGVSASYLTLFENGSIKPDGKYLVPSREILEKIATVFEVAPEVVLNAAGYDVPVPLPEIQYEPDLDTLLGRVEGYSDFDGPTREVIREAAVAAATNMAESLRKLNSQGTIGSRFTREEIAAEEHQQSILRERNTLYIADMPIVGGLDKEDDEDGDDDLD